MRNVQFAIIKDGKVVRHGMCQPGTLANQAGDGETVEVYDHAKHAPTKEVLAVPKKVKNDRDLYSLVPLLMRSIVDESLKEELVNAINKVIK